MSEGMSAFGTLLKIGDGATPEVFTAIAEVTSIDGPSMELETIEITNHSSEDGWREYVGGLLDAGEISLEFNFLPTDATQGYGGGLLQDMVNRTKRNFELVFPDSGATTWGFTALVTKFETSAPHDDKLSGSATLKLSGKPTLV